MRGLNVAGAVTAGINTALVIGEDDDNIWAARICTNEGREEQSGNKECMNWFHGELLYRVEWVLRLKNSQLVGY